MLASQKKLINQMDDLVRGTILRCKGKYPYENIVDFMIVEIPPDRHGSYALLVLSGYKAGILCTYLPKESIPKDEKGYAVNVEWLKLNWSKWGYSDCDLSDVYVIENCAPMNFYD